MRLNGKLIAPVMASDPKVLITRATIANVKQIAWTRSRQSSIDAVALAVATLATVSSTVRRAVPFVKCLGGLAYGLMNLSLCRRSGNGLGELWRVRRVCIVCVCVCVCVCAIDLQYMIKGTVSS